VLEFFKVLLGGVGGLGFLEADQHLQVLVVDLLLGGFLYVPVEALGVLGTLGEILGVPGSGDDLLNLLC